MGESGVGIQDCGSGCGTLKLHELLRDMRLRHEEHERPPLLSMLIYT